MSFTTTQFHTSQVVVITDSSRVIRKASTCFFIGASALFLSTALPSHAATKITQMAIASSMVYVCDRLDKLALKLKGYEVATNQASESSYQQWLTHSMKPPKAEIKIAEPVYEEVKPIPTHPILKALYGHKLECELAGEMRSPSFIRTLVKPTNCKAAQLLRMGEELQLDLALDAEPIISISKGNIAIDTPREDRQVARFSDYWKPSKKIEVAIGVDINNKLVSIDLSDPETCHILFAGMTGSGKSVWLQSLLLSLLIGRSPKEILVIICDPKWVSFKAFDDCANRLIPTINTVDELIIVGDWLIAEMDRRYQLFAAHRVENIDEYNAIVSTEERLPRILLLIDEYGDLKQSCGKDKEGKAKWEKVLNINIRLGQKARASGMPECIGSQKAVDVIDKQIRVNLPARVLLKVLEEGDTECVLGKVSFDGRNLLGRGDLFFNGDRLQSLLCEPSDFAKLTKGEPIYQLEDLATDSKTITVKAKSTDSKLASSHDLASAEIKEINREPLAYEHLQKIVDFLDGRDWTRDNYIKQSVSWYKKQDIPIEELQGTLQLLEVKGYIETRSAGRNGLEARRKRQY